MPVLIWDRHKTDEYYYGRRPFVNNDPERPHEAF